MTKSEITELIKKELDEMLDNGEHRFLVKTMNYHKQTPPGAKGLPDHFIFGINGIYFIEDKIGKDKLSLEQKKFKRYVMRLESKNIQPPWIRYFINVEYNIYNILSTIKELDKFKEI